MPKIKKISPPNPAVIAGIKVLYGWPDAKIPAFSMSGQDSEIVFHFLLRNNSKYLEFLILNIQKI